MIYTVEDTLEILAGLRPRVVNVRIDYSEKNLIKSIGRQVQNGMALTDRQLELVLKKIEKYKDGLTKNNVDVDHILMAKTLRMPLREIDRSQRVFVTVGSDSKTPLISIKYGNTRKFSEIWNHLSKNLIGLVDDKPMQKLVQVSETNILHIVTALQDESFDIDHDILAYFQNIEKILENPTSFAPHADFCEGKVVLKNVSKRCTDYIEKNISENDRNDLFVYVNKLKNFGICHKSVELTEKIEENSGNELVKQITLSTSSRFRINPEKNDLHALVKIIDSLRQWPVLVLVDGENRAADQVFAMYDAVSKVLTNKEMTVFFRLDKTKKNQSEFNQFIHDNHLNNFIGPNTKLVFIEKNKIPKPLIKADWHPTTAIVMADHDYGKTSSFLDDFLNVYYYNNSVAVRNNRLKGAREIAQL